MSLVFATQLIWPGVVLMGNAENLHEEVVEETVDFDFFDLIPDDAFLNVLFVTLLGRFPDKDAYSYFDNAIKGGMSRQRVGELIKNSDEYLDKHAAGDIDDNVSKMNNYLNDVYKDMILYRRPLYNIYNFFQRSSLGGNYLEPGRSYYLIRKINDYGSKESHVVSPGMYLFLNYNDNSAANQGDWIFFGPRIRADMGRYELRIDVSADEGARVHIDVCHDGGQSQLLSAELIGSCKCTFVFNVANAVEDLEVRCLNVSRASLSFDPKEVSIRKL